LSYVNYDSGRFIVPLNWLDWEIRR
jgi:hypothetical protein